MTDTPHEPDTAQETGAPRASGGLKSKAIVAAVSLLLILFLAFAVHSAVSFLSAPEPVAKGIGVGILGITVVGVWALYRELRFGWVSERMADRLAAEGGLPVDDLPRSPGGRIDRAAADAAFEGPRAEVEADRGSWRAWFRLGLAYDAAGDRRRGRSAIHTAGNLYLAERRDARR